MEARTSALQREIQQTKPFQTLGQEALLGLLRTTDIVQRRLAKIMAPAGITQQQYNVLRILRGAGADGLPTLAIADRMVERTPGVTRLIDRLAAKDLVTRTRATDDRRRVDCCITEGGLAVLASLDDTLGAFDGEVLGMLEADEQLKLIELLDRVRQGLTPT
ncbi:MAG: MarR family transcriptional regulator [Acidobacteriota bacterium]